MKKSIFAIALFSTILISSACNTPSEESTLSAPDTTQVDSCEVDSVVVSDTLAK